MDVPEIAYLYLKTIATVAEDGVVVTVARSRFVADGPCYVLTAWNPGDERPTLEENRARNEALRHDLIAANGNPTTSVGSDPDSSHFEEGWLVEGIDEATALALGTKYGQIAIFEITRTEQTVISCDNTWRVSKPTATGQAVAESPATNYVTRTLAYEPAFDGLRAVAVAMVFIFHVKRIEGGGFIGVDIFFVLSGYLITTIMLNEHDKTGRIALVRFWARRLKRLIPALLLTILMTVVAVKLLSDEAVQSSLRSAVIPTLLYYQNWHLIGGGESFLQHTWSLAIEEQWYIVWPIAFGLLYRYGRRALIAVASTCLFAAVIHTARLFDPLSGRDYLGTDTRIQGLLVGAITAAVVARTHSRANHLSARWLDFMSLIGVAVLAWAFVTWSGTDAIVFRGGLLAIGLSSTAILLAARNAKTITHRVLSTKWLARIGTWSYGIYLYQVVVLEFVSEDVVGIGGAPHRLVQAALTLAISYGSWCWLEQPVRNARPGARWHWISMAIAAVLVASMSQVVLASGPVVAGQPWEAELAIYKELAVQHSDDQRLLAVGGTDAVDLRLHGGAIDQHPGAVGVASGARNCGISSATTQLEEGNDRRYECKVLLSMLGDIARSFEPTTVVVLLGKEDVTGRYIGDTSFPVTSRAWQDDAMAQLDSFRSSLPASVANVVIVVPCSATMERISEEARQAAMTTWATYAESRTSEVSIAERPAETCPVNHADSARATWRFLVGYDATQLR